MKQYMKYMLLGLVLVMLAGCGTNEEEPLKAVYTSVEALAYEEALAQLSEIEADRGNRQEISRLMGICQMGLGDYQAAVESLETA